MSVLFLHRESTDSLIMQLFLYIWALLSLHPFNQIKEINTCTNLVLDCLKN